ncbi:hypothetical protein [Marinicella meishanensis]|uniref:hypothetical protein n=1 Tax=Marinicella meishanensis TaxID=2873263 RepID=UPI001CBDD51B|nr:hypothetical protein [Marinicella sp. NBU2979]
MKLMMAMAMVCFFTAAQGTVYTVSFNGNPNADFSDLQAAVNAAVTAGGTHEIRLQSGQSFNTSVSISISNGTDLTISGGWDSGFVSQTDSYTSTSLYAGADLTSYGTSRVLNVNLPDGELTLHNFAVQRGSNVGFGAGINAFVNGTSVFNLTNILLANNFAINTNGATGAGLEVVGFTNSQTNLIGVAISNNLAESTSSTISGVGMMARMNNQAQLTVTDSVITRSRSDSPSQVTGLGVFIDANDQTEVTFTHNYLAQNINTEAASVVGVNASFWLSEQAVGVIANNDVLAAQNDDTDISPNALEQVNLLGRNDSQMWFANNFIHNADTKGIRSESRDSAVMTLINNTFYDHDQASVFITGTSGTRFGNNIMALDNGSNFIHANIQQSNNSTADPQLLNVDEPMIAENSPARDMGNNNPWPNTLPEFDFYDNNRIGNTGIVDIGAAEVPIADEIPIFVTGFEELSDD